MSAITTTTGLNTRGTPVEPSIRLIELEAVIERGLETFVEVGRALIEIRDTRLYKDTHTNFEDYCRERWQKGRRWAYQLMDATAVVDNVCATAHIPAPNSERVARELVGLEPEQQREAWTRTVEQSETGRPTTAEVRTVVAEIITEQRPPKTMVAELEEKPIPALSRSRVQKCQKLSNARKETIRMWRDYYRRHPQTKGLTFIGDDAGELVDVQIEGVQS